MKAFEVILLGTAKTRKNNQVWHCQATLMVFSENRNSAGQTAITHKAIRDIRETKIEGEEVTWNFKLKEANSIAINMVLRCEVSEILKFVPPRRPARTQ